MKQTDAHSHSFTTKGLTFRDTGPGIVFLVAGIILVIAYLLGHHPVAP